MHGWHDTRISDRVTVTVTIKILSTDSSVVIDVEYIFSELTMSYIQTLEKTEWAIENEQFRDTVNKR